MGLIPCRSTIFRRIPFDSECRSLLVKPETPADSRGYQHLFCRHSVVICTRPVTAEVGDRNPMVAPSFVVSADAEKSAVGIQ